MTKRKAAALGLLRPDAGWAGELLPALPDLAEALHDTGIDPRAFAEALRVPLTYCLASVRGSSDRGQPAAVIKWLERAAGDIDAALADGRLHHLPYHAEPCLDHAAWKLSRRSWGAVVQSGDTTSMRHCLEAGAEILRSLRIRDRRPRSYARDQLLRIAVERLRSCGLPPLDAEHHATLVLKACGMTAPDASAARAARRGRGAISV